MAVCRPPCRYCEGLIFRAFCTLPELSEPLIDVACVDNALFFSFLRSPVFSALSPDPLFALRLLELLFGPLRFFLIRVLL